MSQPSNSEIASNGQEAETNNEVEADCDQETQGDDQHQKQEYKQNNRQIKHKQNDQFSRQPGGIQKFNHKNKAKNTFKRINVDPTRRYHQPEARESWGPNVKGKKFRKEKGKKKRSTGTGAKIDGSVRSIRFDT